MEKFYSVNQTHCVLDVLQEFLRFSTPSQSAREARNEIKENKCKKVFDRKPSDNTWLLAID